MATRYDLRPVTISAALAAMMLFATSCNRAAPSASAGPEPANDTAAAAPVGEKAIPQADLGPVMLSTVGLYDVAPVTDVQAKEGRFAIRPSEQYKQLFVNGIAWQYVAGAGIAPTPIEANDDIRLVGTIELPRESVAWVLITGGTACPGTHVLVSIKDGRSLVGRGIPGCDDRGTMRRVDDHIVFEAGGSTGTYRDGELKVTRDANEGAEG